MKQRKILYGVCGIGNGHTQRQLPLIEYFSKRHLVVIFAYDASLKFFKEYFKDNELIKVLEVAVPFYVGNSQGIDFEATDKLPSNQKNYVKINGAAFNKAKKILGVPDLVISDYEPISAEYAYRNNAPLITIDQQSKYLVGDFPTELHDQTYIDEVVRLKLFFPNATCRIACSFFDVTKKDSSDKVLMFPPIIKPSVEQMRNIPAKPTSILVYFSAQKDFSQNLEEVAGILSLLPEVQFNIFTPSQTYIKKIKNICYFEHGDKRFSQILEQSAGIISTAGHSLLSEAMYLGIPVYALPLSVYEQQMNAEIINKHGFGISDQSINIERLTYFISNLNKFRKNIKTDTSVLLKGNAKKNIIEFIEKKFFK